MRTSEVLRDVLGRHPHTKTFTVGMIVSAIEASRDAAGEAAYKACPAEMSLVLFSAPGILPVPGAEDISGIPATAIASNLIAGRHEMVLPKFILDRSVPRRSLAIIIHAILPVVERVETVTRPRWTWTCHPAMRRALGVLIFLLSAALATPFLGFNLAHATSIFTISLGMVEQDGAAILLGASAGIASLVLLLGMTATGRMLKTGISRWFRKALHAVGLHMLLRRLKRMGIKWAGLLKLEWRHLLLLWDPEAGSSPRPQRRDRLQQASPPRITAQTGQTISPVTGGRKFERKQPVFKQSAAPAAVFSR